MAIVGGGAGSVRGNRHIKTPQGTPMANVMLRPVAKVRRGAQDVWRQHGDGRSMSSLCQSLR